MSGSKNILRALDLFCGGGGVAKGLQAAGFDVTGIDLHPQPHYCGDDFKQMDALDVGVFHHTWASEFDFIWASPPCQAYCGMQRINTRAQKRDHPRLIEPVRDMLKSFGRPYAIENVTEAPLLDPVQLCGSMFGLGVRRHRLFECSFFLLQPQCRHKLSARPIAVYGDHPQQPGDKTYRVNRARNLAEGQQAMGIDWMPWRPLTQAIPPAYSEFVGRAAIAHIHAERQAA